LTLRHAEILEVYYSCDNAPEDLTVMQQEYDLLKYKVSRNS